MQNNSDDVSQFVSQPQFSLQPQPSVQQPQSSSPMQSQQSTQAQPLLRVEHLRQYFNAGSRSKIFRAVDDVSFEIARGEVFGLVGESGCGKTTTGRSIIHLYKITGGNIYFDERRINAGIWEYEQKIREARFQKNPDMKEIIAREKEKIRQARSVANSTKFEPRIQMIFQDPSTSLDPRMTVGEIIAEGLLVRGERDRHAVGKKVSRVLDRVGLLPEYAERYPHEFSGGQRQRIGIARALVMEPQLIIADEPVSALDVSVKAQIINLLNDLRHDLGLSVLFIAHDLSVVKYFCDRIAVMYRGKILETAGSDALFANPQHPYTRSLISAVPLPDPVYERSRQRIVFDAECSAQTDNGGGAL